jgi:hypothetical protein
MDVALEGFLDRVEMPATEEIWPVVEELAGISLTVIVYSHEGLPTMELLIEQMDLSAADNCGVSHGDCGA